MRKLLRSFAALGLMYAAGAAVGAAEQALRDAGARGGAAAGTEVGMVTSDPHEPAALDRAEFFCRHLMTELVRMEVRGFDTGKAKAQKRAELDEALDVYNLTKAAGGLMARPPEANGDPASEMCRWCESAKRHIRGHLFCTRCDSAGDGTTTILATWDMEASP